IYVLFYLYLFSSRRRHTRSKRDWSSDVCSSDLAENVKLSEEPNDVLDMYGTPVHEYNVADVKAGDTFELDISYEKDSEITTLEALEQHAPDDDIHQGLAATDDNDGAGTFISNESAIMISISMVIAGLFVYLGLRNRQKAPIKGTNKSQ